MQAAEQQGTQQSVSTTESTATPMAQVTGATTDTHQPPTSTHSPPSSNSADITAQSSVQIPTSISIAVGIAAILALTLALPFLAGFQNLMGIVIIGIGLYEAWKLNKRETLQITGPFEIGATRT
jgi:hypothetical protein